MVDAVLSYHADPISCGVTRFSQQLAKRLDVPWSTLDCPGDYSHPLVSVKASELPLNDTPYARFTEWDLFIHDEGVYHVISALNALTPTRIFTANRAISEAVKYVTIPAWCPSLVDAQPREPIAVLSFGMASKIRTELYATLKEKLDATGEPYVVYVSAALHDGTTFSDAAQSFETLRRLFGANFVFLGTLSDEAMVDRLRTCTYVAAFFEKGLRENNTSVHAAIDAGATVITNVDRHTPDPLKNLVHDVDLIRQLPHAARRKYLRDFYGWDKLVELIKHA